MNETKIKRGKAWSKKKRITTSAKISLLIFSVAILMGGSLYSIARMTNLVDRQDIKAEVMEQTLTNDDLIDELVTNAKLSECTNQAYGFRIKHTSQVTEISTEETRECMDFSTRSSTSVASSIGIYLWEVPREESLEIALSGLENILTDVFIHETYEAVLVKGLSNGEEKVMVIMTVNEGMSWIFEISPSDSLTEKRFLKIVSSFVKLD